ncbi:MAG: hypothetical protein J0I32_09690 [Sphingobacteriales bacterium]|nr:hypothetical protein [Sphingobacteriales bacterium]OJW00270.1 MAG: hypothetical protein BGO52_04065 [Sphingobacteriales bacterium 44-61]
MTTSLLPIIVIAAAIIATYYLIIFFAFRKRAMSMLGQTTGRKWNPPIQQNFSAQPHEFIDKPIDHPMEDDVLTLVPRSDEDEPPFEMVEDEETVLLKAAEIVVEKVQDIIDTSPNPPNHQDIYSKIKNVTGRYQLFRNTEYFDAINSFIAISVERDCGLQFTKQQLLDLWQ